MFRIRRQLTKINGLYGNGQAKQVNLNNLVQPEKLRTLRKSMPNISKWLSECNVSPNILWSDFVHCNLFVCFEPIAQNKNAHGFFGLYLCLRCYFRIVGMSHIAICGSPDFNDLLFYFLFVSFLSLSIVNYFDSRALFVFICKCLQLKTNRFPKRKYFAQILFKSQFISTSILGTNVVDVSGERERALKMNAKW